MNSYSNKGTPKKFIIVEGIDLVKRTNEHIMADKVIFNAILQTAETENRNKRKYTKDALVKALQMKMEMIEPRGFLGELDHPLMQSYDDDKAVDLRLSTVLWERCALVLTKFWWEENTLWGTIESTLFGFGPQIVKIVKDKVPLGFSLRAIGQAEPNGDSMIVNNIDFIVSYDAVTMPSHAEATMRELTEERYYNLNESLNFAAMRPVNHGNNYLIEQQTKQKKVNDVFYNALLKWE